MLQGFEKKRKLEKVLFTDHPDPNVRPRGGSHSVSQSELSKRNKLEDRTGGGAPKAREMANVTIK